MEEAKTLQSVETDIGGPHRYSPLPVASADVELPRLTVTVLRSLPVGRLFETAREALVSSLRFDLPDIARETWPPGHLNAVDRWNEQLAPERDALAAPRTGRDLGDDHYRLVAKIYADAARSGAKPTAAVAEHFVVSKSAAAKKVARARERGFLPGTSRGRVGPIEDEL